MANILITAVHIVVAFIVFRAIPSDNYVLIFFGIIFTTLNVWLALTYLIESLEQSDKKD